jgi:predicted membrane protein
MTQAHQLDRYKQHMAAQGVGESTAFPPAWRMLWSVGIELAPPPFLSFVSMTLVAGFQFGPLFGLGAWLLGNRGLREMPFNEALWVALFTGAAFGLMMAAYYRRLARKHRLASWAAFQASGRRA